MNIKTKHTALLFPLSTAQQPLMGQGHLIFEASRSLSDKLHSVVLLWTSDQPVAENSTWQNTTVTGDRLGATQWDLSLQPQQASGRSPAP